MFLCIMRRKSVKKLNNPWYLDGFVLLESFSSKKTKKGKVVA